MGRSHGVVRFRSVSLHYGSVRTLDGVDRVRGRHRPRLLSDNSPCYLAKDLAD